MRAKINLTDLENSNVNLSVDLRDESVLKTIAESVREQKESRDALFKSLGIDCLRLTTDGDFVDAFTRFFMSRERKALKG